MGSEPAVHPSVQLNPPVTAKKAMVGSRESALVTHIENYDSGSSGRSGLFGLSRSFGLARLFGLTGSSDRQTRETRPTGLTRQTKEHLNPFGFSYNQNGFS
jgi:hypothetical protein